MPSAARTGDLHACPSHSGGPLSSGSETVRIGGLPAARAGDRATCNRGADTIRQGSPSVLIEGRQAARAGDKCSHNGVIASGLASVQIGNSNDPSGGPLTLPGSPSSVPTLHGSPVSTQVLESLASIVGSLQGGDDTLGATMRAAAGRLQLALADKDLPGLRLATAALEPLLQQFGLQKAGAADGDKAKKAQPAGGEAPSPSLPPSPSLGWQQRPIPADPVRSVNVRDGRVLVNGAFAGIHAIGESDLLALQAGGRVERVVQRVAAAGGAGRNCARVFCMFRNALGDLSPHTTAGYWTALDALVVRLCAYGMFGHFVLLADCDRRPDGTGGVMPSWADRRGFVRDAGQFFKGKPVIVTLMNEPWRNGATDADAAELVEALNVFREASNGTVPAAVGDPCFSGDADVPAAAARQRALSSAGAPILVLHARRDQPDDRRYRWWIDRLTDFGDMREPALPGNPYLYHDEPMEFGARGKGHARESDAEAAVAAACVCAVDQVGFCYHHVASVDPATPGLDLSRVARLVPQGPDFTRVGAGSASSPIQGFEKDDFRGGGIRACSNGREAWAVGYGSRVVPKPRVAWRGVTPEVVWRGERVVLWRAA